MSNAITGGEAVTALGIATTRAGIALQQVDAPTPAQHIERKLPLEDVIVMPDGRRLRVTLDQA